MTYIAVTDKEIFRHSSDADTVKSHDETENDGEVHLSSNVGRDLVRIYAVLVPEEFLITHHSQEPASNHNSDISRSVSAASSKKKGSKRGKATPESNPKWDETVVAFAKYLGQLPAPTGDPSCHESSPPVSLLGPFRDGRGQGSKVLLDRRKGHGAPPDRPHGAARAHPRSIRPARA